MKQLLAMHLKVRCVDGNVHDGVKFYVEDGRRIYAAEDGTELTGIDCIEKCTAVVPPMVLAMALQTCEDCE